MNRVSPILNFAISPCSSISTPPSLVISFWYGDILFIDASQHFEKVGNQNQLRAEDIDRIVSTYRKRESSEKFSHVAKLSEVEENDFNLNIPRYVDTFEEEAEIDLEAVRAERLELKAELNALEVEMEGYLKELGY